MATYSQSSIDKVVEAASKRESQVTINGSYDLTRIQDHLSDNGYSYIYLSVGSNKRVVNIHYLKTDFD